MDVSSFGLARIAVDDPVGICRSRKRFEHRFGRRVPLRRVLAQEPLDNGGEVRAYLRRRVDRRWIVVEDRVQRIHR